MKPTYTAEEEKNMEEKASKSGQNIIETESGEEIKVGNELKPDDWLCIACNKKITSDKERFEYNNQSEFQFVNPAGYYFDIITFSTADGCIEKGISTLEFTWFAGHSWSFAVCSRCSNHLGWKYDGKYSFYGLIKSRLIKGAALFN
jgi:hypothetical protein